MILRPGDKPPYSDLDSAVRTWCTRLRCYVLERPPSVTTKADFARRYALGEFGNASPTWGTLDEFIRRDERFRDGLFHLRNRTPGGPTWYNLTAAQLVARWVTEGEGWYASAMAPEHRKTLQGEVWDSDTGLYLNYNTQRLPMREGMAVESLHAEGTRARLLLRTYMCPSSYDWLFTLLERYPGHVVEFSSYEVEWGTFPGFNTVIWEVRGGY